MSKRIVVGLDGSPYSDNAMTIALRRARNFHATLIGVAVVDGPGISQLGAGAHYGALHISQETVSARLDHAKRHASEIINRFRERCEEDGVKYEDVIHTGTPCEVLFQEARSADLMILGMKTYFRRETQEEADETLLQMLKAPVCPVIAVPNPLQLPENVVIAYDGSRGAARAMQAYVHVSRGFPPNVNISLIWVADDTASTSYTMKKAVEYCAEYGFEAEPILLTGSPAEAILGFTRKKGRCIIVLGEPAKSGLAQFLFGSVAGAIIEDGTMPVFVYH